MSNEAHQGHLHLQNKRTVERPRIFSKKPENLLNLPPAETNLSGFSLQIPSSNH